MKIVTGIPMINAVELVSGITAQVAENAFVIPIKGDFVELPMD